MLDERTFATRWGTWWQENKDVLGTKSYAVEHKVTNGGTFNLSQWHKKQPHQYENLHNSTTDVGVYHKMSDQSSDQKPFDGFVLRNAKVAYLIIYYGKHKHFFHIPVSKIPDAPSISYQYCLAHFTPYTLLPVKRQRSVAVF